jgi:hypothetical protein
VELGKGEVGQVRAEVSACKGGKLEVWLDDLGSGRMIASVPVIATGGGENWISCAASLRDVSGRHDVYVKFPAGDEGDIHVKRMQFVRRKRAIK